MPSIAEIVSLVAERGCPVLFLDTCVLFDILRSAHRENIPDATVECACRLRDAIQSSPPLVTSEIASVPTNVPAPKFARSLLLDLPNPGPFDMHNQRNYSEPSGDHRVF